MGTWLLPGDSQVTLQALCHSFNGVKSRACNLQLNKALVLTYKSAFWETMTDKPGGAAREDGQLCFDSDVSSFLWSCSCQFSDPCSPSHDRPGLQSINFLSSSILHHWIPLDAIGYGVRCRHQKGLQVAGAREEQKPGIAVVDCSSQVANDLILGEDSRSDAQDKSDSYFEYQCDCSREYVMPQ